MDITLDIVIEKCQKYLENIPTIVVGSGASVPYGLPTMAQLGEEIKTSLHSKYEGDIGWQSFLTHLENTGNLEVALHKTTVSEEIVNDIITITWQFILSCDHVVFERVYKSNYMLQLSRIFDKLLQSHPRRINVITANYDRLIEYAADAIRVNIDLGFSGNYIKHFTGLESHVCPKTVNLCKVHGSLDWYKRVRDNQLVSVTSRDVDTNELFPVIVTPGFKKYQETHMEPYRTLIMEADKYIKDASSFLCIGYGFNDEHLQPKLIEQIQILNKPIVIVTHTLSEKGTEILQNSQKFIVFEYLDVNRTKISSDFGEVIVNGNVWELGEFINIWLGE